MIYKKLIQFTLLIFGIVIIYFSYYYLPSQNTGSIKIDSSKINEKEFKNKTLDDKNIKAENITDQNKNTSSVFKNTEYINKNKVGDIFTTRAKESIIYNNKSNLIYLNEPYSFTRLKKDQSLIEINSKTGLFNKSTKTTLYNDNVIIKNKNYTITSDQARYDSEKNIIVISGNVVMKDMSEKLLHIAYSDIVEINTLNNNITASMKSQNKKVIAKKF